MSTQEYSKVILNSDQIQKRVKELGRQISDAYDGKTLHVVCVLENAFMFMADLVRTLDVPVVCHFIKAYTRETIDGTGTPTTEIFFKPEISVKGQHVLLVEGLVQSGVTSEFLMRNLTARGAVSVKMVAFLDKQAARRVQLQPDFFGFMIHEPYVIGYGMGAPDEGRNLPFVASKQGQAAAGQ